MEVVRGSGGVLGESSWFEVGRRLCGCFEIEDGRGALFTRSVGGGYLVVVYE